METATQSIVWKNVTAKGSNIEVVSAQQYLRVSGKTLFRRLLVFLVVIAVVALVVGHGVYTSLKQWDNEQLVERGLSALRVRILPRAFYDSDGRFPRTFSYDCYMHKPKGNLGAPRCHPGTRVAILDEIHAWSNCTASDKKTCPPIFWLYSPFELGKSAIAQTLSEEWHSEGRLAASYMISADSASVNEQVAVVPTISYQLHLAFGTRYRTKLATTIVNDMSILTRSIITQAESLIHQPLIEIGLDRRGEPSWLHFIRWLFHLQLSPPLQESHPNIIVIDGLDSVLGDRQQGELLEALGALTLNEELKLRLFVSSKPTPPIMEIFDYAPNFKNSTMRMKLLNDRNTTADVDHVVRSGFERIRRARGISDDWPSEAVIRGMVERFRGQFSAVDVVMSCVGSRYCDPKVILDECLIAAPFIPNYAPEIDRNNYTGQTPIV